MMRIGRFLPSALTLLVFVLAYALLLFFGRPFYSDHDVLWHIASGDLFWQLKAVPSKDPWAFTSGSQPWYLISWFFDALLSLVHGWGGAKAAYLMGFFFPAIVVALLARHMQLRPGVESNAIILLSICATLAFTAFSTSRPQILAFLLAAVMHRQLHASRNSGRWGGLLWLPVLMAVWGNAHGSFVVGLTLLGAYGLEAMAFRRWDWFRRLFITGVACAAALLLNPYGFEMVIAMRRTLDSVITRYITEWMPFVFGNDMGVSGWVLLFLAAGVFREKNAPLADKIITAIWAVFMLFSTRNAAMFIVVSAPALAIALQGFIVELGTVVTRRPDPLAALAQPLARIKLAVVALCAVFLSYTALDWFKPGWLEDKETRFTPVISYLQQHYPGKRFLNDYDIGGQLIYQAKDELPLFIDGRAGTVYSEQVLSDYLDFLWLKKDWDKTVEKYGIEGIVVANTHRFATAYESGQYHDRWKEVFRDETASVYVKR